MGDQIILACDNQGEFSGEYIFKEEGHKGKGKKHLAIAVLLKNSKGQILLQKRKHKVFDDIWDVTGATHPLHLPDGKNESFEEATVRCLKREYGISAGEIRELKVVGVFNYFAQYGELCENEHCAILVGYYDGDLKLNPDVGYNYKWMAKDEFLKDIEANPTNYSPWAAPGVKILKTHNFFN